MLLRGLSPCDVVQKLVLSKQALDRRPRQRCGVDGDVDLGPHFAFFAFAHFARAALRASALRAPAVIAAYRFFTPAPAAAFPPRRPRATAARPARLRRPRSALRIPTNSCGAARSRS